MNKIKTYTIAAKAHIKRNAAAYKGVAIGAVIGATGIITGVIIAKNTETFEDGLNAAYDQILDIKNIVNDGTLANFEKVEIIQDETRHY